MKCPQQTWNQPDQVDPSTYVFLKQKSYFGFVISGSASCGCVVASALRCETKSYIFTKPLNPFLFSNLNHIPISHLPQRFVFKISFSLQNISFSSTCYLNFLIFGFSLNLDFFFFLRVKICYFSCICNFPI